ncbi:hypothetical protein [Sphaerisporangium sp. TRM90804]|uniref:hypothetical protein n=1 Tax=Sphaerisporangium sp. TRM90804 TaxID=3031113 RepID=UPI002447D522|nr:hypothetical protein [Sphaerisporangium sp. TRM90804]MDH2427417.1 hypothetical protein [Sphaerisporangium sp. TRM90804]
MIVRVTPDWAIHGKRPGARDGDEILAHSQGRFTRDEFAQIIARFAPGGQADLPQVTTSWVDDGENAHVGMAIQERSDDRDGLGRDIAVTRYFCAPYAQLAHGPVSYEALYTGFGGCALPVEGLPTVHVPAPDWASTAAAVDDTAMAAAALLLTGRPVCVVGAEHVPLADRLRFLDTAAALLPYGFRSRLTTSTWTDSAVRHRIRLSFARHAPAEAHKIRWSGPVSVDEYPDTARRYHAMLANHEDPGDLVTRFARDTRPRSMKAADLAAFVALIEDDDARYRVPPRTRTAHQAAAELLIACADGLDQGRTERLAGRLDRLDALRGAVTAGDHMRDIRNIVGDRRLLVTAQSLDRELRERLYGIVLSMAYGSLLTLDDFEEIRRNADHWIAPPLAAALRRLTPAEPAVTLKLAAYLDPEEQVSVLKPLDSDVLIKAATREPVEPHTLHTLCAVLTARGDDRANRAAITRELGERGDLLTAVQVLHADHPDDQVWSFHTLLTVAHGQVIDRETLERHFLPHLGSRSAPLLTALAMMCTPEARGRLAEAVLMALFEQAGITRELLQRIGIAPDPPGRGQADAGEALSDPPGGPRRLNVLDPRRWRT